MKYDRTRSALILPPFIAALLALGACPVDAAGLQAVHSRVPAAVSRLVPVGRLSGAQILKLSISLPLRNQSELTEQLRELNDPSSPNYRHYLTPEQFVQRFGPSEKDYQAVIDFARSHGLKVTATHPNRTILDVEGAVADVEKTFYVRMLSYQHPTEGRKFFAPDTAPSLDLGVPILDVIGLDNYALPHPNYHIKPAALLAKAKPLSGSGTYGTYAGKDFRAAYVPGTSLTGTGQSIALLEFDGYYPIDITNYEGSFGLPNVPLVNVPVSGGVSYPPGDDNSEVALDIEMDVSMAPGVSAIYVYEAPNGTSWDSIISRIATDNLAKQISCSWTGGGPDPTAEGIFQQMAMQGQSFFTAAGDNDAYTGAIPFPAESPSITVVGGTTLTTTGAAGSYVSETVWNWGGGIGSGGGISTDYAIPSWQQGINMTSNLGSTTMRNIPDVALTADNVYVAYNDGSWGDFGGTSCAAPLWAAFTALVNQQSVANTGKTVGFVNPAIYAIGAASGYGADIHDTTTGNNFSSSSPAEFPAETGYDLCTGWGTPNGTALINALAGPPSPSIENGPPPPLAGLGVAYSFTFITSGQPAATFSLLSGNLPPGLNLSSAGVISGMPTQLGSFTATVDATNGTPPDATQTFTINVQAPAAPGFTDGPPTASAQVGLPYSFTYTASGAPSPAFALYSGSLPPGLTLTSSGVLSGVPTQSGVYSGSVSASNGVGTAVRQSFTITVDQAPAFTDGPPTSPTTIGTLYNFTYTASGFPSPTFSVTPGTLPPGFTLNPNGLLSGISTQAGTFSGTVTASNGISPSASQAFSITVKPLSAPSFSNAPLTVIITINTPLNFDYTANGTPSPTFSIISGSLPAGLSFSTSGVLSGTPTHIGVYTGTITASNGISPNATQNYSITVLNNLVQHYSILHDFADGSVPNDGNQAWASLIQGSDQNFYGTTVATGSATTGIAYKITSSGVDSVLHTFTDSSVPNVGRGSYASLIQSSGLFYGTTCYSGDGGGGVFKMTSSGTVSLMHLFGDGTVHNDGSSPFAPLILAADGNFYGTTDIGGSAGEGTIFRITPQGLVTILHSFGDGSVANDGTNPKGALMQDTNDGNFYGMTTGGGSANEGVAYKMTVQGNAATVAILHQFGSFSGDGTYPVGGLTQGADGSLYGNTEGGGTTKYGSYYGTAFKITTQGTMTILHNFWDGSTGYDGYSPNAGLTLGSDGNFYGTTSDGGNSTNNGTIFRMTPQGTVTVLYTFGTITNDGTNPYSGLVQGSDGSFYGTTIYGGTTTGFTPGGYGTVFKLTLVSPPAFTSAASATFTAGQSNTFAVTATGAPIFSASGLPSWASLNQATGVLSGTPPITSAGSYTVILTANNGASPNATQTFILSVGQAPLITNGPPPAAAVNTAYSFTYGYTGSPAPLFSLFSGALPAGLALSPSGVLSGTPSTAGSYTGTVLASNGVNPNATQNFTMTVFQTFSDWEKLFFTTLQMQDVNTSGPNATPQHDGIQNLLKFLFDINPSLPMSTTDKAALPVAGMTNIASVPYLTLTYRQNPTASGITVNVQTSPDLQTWTTVTPAFIQNVGTDSATGDPIIQDQVLLATPIPAKEFIRLRVTTP